MPLSLKAEVKMKLKMKQKRGKPNQKETRGLMIKKCVWLASKHFP